MAVASLPVMEWQPTSIFTGEATFAYLTRALPFAEIYVPFVDVTGACNVASLTAFGGADRRHKT